MEKQHKTNTIYHVFIISLAILSFVLCIICELKKSKKKELRVDGDLCYLPQSQAFGYGLAALMCSSGAQLIGTGLFIYCRRSNVNVKSFKSCIASILFFLSWASFVTMMILTGTATSMNRRQANGVGWLDGRCYLVKKGVYAGSGTLVLIATNSTLLSCYLMHNKSRPVHAQPK